MQMPQRHLSVFALAGSLLTGCAAFGDRQPGIAKVEELVARIERVHVEVELARDAATAAREGIQSFASTSFQGDRVLAMKSVLGQVADSKARAVALRQQVGSMRLAADPVFSQWRLQLDSIASADLRARSEERMRRTRDAYDSIAVVAVPMLDDLDAFNRRLSDLSLFLNLDHNPTALATIGGDLVELERAGKGLSSVFDRCLVAAQSYLAAVAPSPSDVAAEPIR